MYSKCTNWKEKMTQSTRFKYETERTTHGYADASKTEPFQPVSRHQLKEVRIERTTRHTPHGFDTFFLCYSFFVRTRSLSLFLSLLDLFKPLCLLRYFACILIGSFFGYFLDLFSVLLHRIIGCVWFILFAFVVSSTVVCECAFCCGLGFIHFHEMWMRSANSIDVQLLI